MTLVQMKMKAWRDTQKQCDKRGENWVAYMTGDKDCPPHFPVPAIHVEVEFHSWAEPGPFHSSVTWTEHRQFCPDCEGLMRDLVAIVDFNWDRCMDFNYSVGRYVAGQELTDGVTLYLESTRYEL